MIYYLPSCKFTAASPEASAAIRAWLAARGVAVAGCCKAPQSRFGRGDTVLFNCSSCCMVACERSPEANVLSVYEFLAAAPDFPWPDYGGERITVQDCRRMRERRAMLDAVRACLLKMNMVPVELKENRERAAFDGTFLFNPIDGRTVNAAPKAFAKLIAEAQELLPPQEQRRRMREWAGRYVTRRVAAYCNGCTKGARDGGADAVHLLALMAGAL